MGHSDSFPLREMLSPTEATHPAVPEVRVWGDMSYIQPWQADWAEQDAHATVGASSSALASANAPEDLYRRIGQLTRSLHDAMRELGHHDQLVDARDHLPEARDRLAYIARLTGEAAEKVLNSVDRARLLHDELARQAQSLQERWTSMAAPASGEDCAAPLDAALVNETREFFLALQKQNEVTNAILTDIMMAQDFHDLTGQVIRKVVALAHTLEEQLVKLLLDANRSEPRDRAGGGHGANALVLADSRGDVVVDQAGVDKLLASLGF